MKPGDLLKIYTNLKRCGISEIRHCGTYANTADVLIDVADMRAFYTPEDIRDLAEEATHWEPGKRIDAYLV